eukprot:TRINITY_DN50993_c0_g1_i1.p2 TRINITY_DN50993_c0_g1~~TRINITY_DN50993_c0_g1_i1.p2  ORF type:complete len:157 (-),score=30.19 TRINITY_DN50993_c0_g1_i1:44-514(-)
MSSAAHDGVDRLGVSEVDDSLGRALEHTKQLEERARQLQAHFQQAQKGMSEISRLCDEADTSVVRSQSLLNRSAHRIHELNERMQHLLEAAPESPAQEPSFGSGYPSSVVASAPAGTSVRPASTRVDGRLTSSGTSSKTSKTGTTGGRRPSRNSVQ